MPPSCPRRRRLRRRPPSSRPPAAASLAAVGAPVADAAVASRVRCNLVRVVRLVGQVSEQAALASPPLAHKHELGPVHSSAASSRS
jgi:hypothetical protein